LKKKNFCIYKLTSNKIPQKKKQLKLKKRQIQKINLIKTI
jgi:hypothetical protein